MCTTQFKPKRFYMSMLDSKYIPREFGHEIFGQSIFIVTEMTMRILVISRIHYICACPENRLSKLDSLAKVLNAAKKHWGHWNRLTLNETNNIFMIFLLKWSVDKKNWPYSIWMKKVRSPIAKVTHVRQKWLPIHIGKKKKKHCPLIVYIDDCQ